MKAIVLSCDKYHPLASHMLNAYEVLWPTHPFTFMVPYQNKQNLDSWKGISKISMVRTPPEIKGTVLTLLEGTNDDEWIYWCIDDKYPTRIDQSALTAIYQTLSAFPSTESCGVAFTRCRRWQKPEYLYPGTHEFCMVKRVGIWPSRVRLLQRRDYSQIWLHQFIKAKALRRLFNRFPEEVSTPKELDKIKNELELPPDHKLYVTQKSYASYAESTTRGHITKNTASSMKKHGFPIPKEFKVTDKTILIK